MQTLFLLTLTALCASTLSEDLEPAKCCTDHQFQASIGTIGGTVYPQTGNAVFIDGYVNLAYDYYRQRLGTESHMRSPNGTMTISKSLMDYASNTRYVYADGKCTVTTIDEAMESPCIPNDARFIGASVLGFGAEQLELNTWEFVKPNTDQVIKRSVTKNGCIPVISAFYGTFNGAAMDIVEFYSFFKPGLDKPSDLDLPASTTGCVVITKDASSQPGVGR